MPHAVFEGGMDLAKIQQQLQPTKERTELGHILESINSFLRADGRMLLVEGKCVELGPAQFFFIALDQDHERLQVRIFNHPRPPRTPGVLRLVGTVAKLVQELGGVYLHGNLAEFSAENPSEK